MGEGEEEEEKGREEVVGQKKMKNYVVLTL